MPTPPHQALLRSLLVLASSALCAGVQGDIIIDNFAPARNDRFANDPSFIGAGRNWSGVAITETARWVTMISPNVFLSAFHFAPGSGASVTFHANNDPTGPAVTRAVSAGERIGTSDLWIGTLNVPLDVSYTFYDYATEPIASAGDFTSSAYYNQVAYLLGRSPTTRPASQDLAIGSNQLDEWLADAVAGDTTDDALVAVRDGTGDANYRPYEALLQVGDSGGPLFIQDPGAPGGLRLVGINWFIAEGYPTESATASGFSYVGNYTSEIQSYLNAFSIPLVPEMPAGGPVACLFILGYGLARCRRRASPKSR